MSYLKSTRRWIQPYHTGLAGTSATPGVAGRVYLEEFEVERDTVADGIVLQNAATVAGNARVGIYGKVVTEDTCLDAPLKVESADTALSGTNAPQIITFTPTKLKKGRYYMAIQFSDVTHTFLRQGNSTQVVGWGQYYDRGGGYGAFTTPCPAVTNTGSNLPGLRVRSTGA